MTGPDAKACRSCCTSSALPAGLPSPTPSSHMYSVNPASGVWEVHGTGCTLIHAQRVKHRVQTFGGLVHKGGASQGATLPTRGTCRSLPKGGPGQGMDPSGGSCRLRTTHAARGVQSLLLGDLPAA